MNKTSLLLTIFVNVLISVIFIYGLSALLSASFWAAAGAVICIGFASNGIENVFETTLKLIKMYWEKDYKDNH